MYTLRPRLSRLVMVIPTRSFSCGRSASTSHIVSTVHRGTIFEDRSLHLLQQDMSMSLRRVGGKEDGGIDLLGWWWLPHESDVATYTSASASSSCLLLKRRRRIRVVGQCKAEKKKMGPNYVRELEGVLYRLLTSQQQQQPQDLGSSQADTGTNHGTSLADQNRGPQPQESIPVVALLISESSFTKSTILRAHSSPIPFLLLHLPPIDNTASLESLSEQTHTTTTTTTTSLGSVGAVWCNPALVGTQGLLKGRMEVRWERHSHGEWGRPALWWDGDRLPSWIPDLISTGNSGVDVHALDAKLDIGTSSL